VVGTALAVAVMIGLTRWARGTHARMRRLASKRGLDDARQSQLVGICLAVLLMVSVPASYYVAHWLSAPFNHWLDQVLPASDSRPSP
jgi:hypothetical protein